MIPEVGHAALPLALALSALGALARVRSARRTRLWPVRLRALASMRPPSGRVSKAKSESRRERERCTSETIG